MTKFEQRVLVILSFLLLIIGYISGSIIISLFALFISLLLWEKNKKPDTYRGGKNGNRADS